MDFLKLLVYYMFINFVFIQKIYSSENKSNQQLRVIGGKPAKRGQFPFMVLLVVGEYQCGGFIFKKNVVITAAHCLYDEHGVRIPNRQITAYVGDIYQDTSTLKRFRVLFTKHPPDYMPGTSSSPDDIALLMIEGSFWKHEPTQYVSSISLAKNNFPSKKKCKIMGWGRYHPDYKTASRKLLYAYIQLYNHSKCQERYSKAGVLIMDKMICGFTKGIDTCQGDSGGPLICPLKQKYAVAGITSFGIGCATDIFPGVYTNVIPYRTWIEQTIVRNREIDVGNNCKLRISSNILLIIIGLMISIFNWLYNCSVYC